MSVLWQNVPNRITTLRLVMVPVLWALALADLPVLVGLGMALCGISDWLDGVLARRLGQTSASGAKYDSIVDQLLLISAVIWVIMLRPELFQENLIAVIIALAMYLLSLAVGLIKFRRVANLHLLISRVTAYFMYVLLVQTFVADRYSPLLFWSSWALFTLSSTETLILQLISPEVDEHMVSLIRVLRRRRTESVPAQESIQRTE